MCNPSASTDPQHNKICKSAQAIEACESQCERNLRAILIYACTVTPLHLFFSAQCPGRLYEHGTDTRSEIKDTAADDRK